MLESPCAFLVVHVSAQVLTGRHGAAAPTVAVAVCVRGRVWGHVTLTTMEASPAIMRQSSTGKLTTCEAELQQPDAQRSLGDGRAQGMMHVVTQHMPHAVRA